MCLGGRAVVDSAPEPTAGGASGCTGDGETGERVNKLAAAAVQLLFLSLIGVEGGIKSGVKGLCSSTESTKLAADGAVLASGGWDTDPIGWAFCVRLMACTPLITFAVRRSSKSS